MPAFDRLERFQNIRAGLGFPLENFPNTDQQLRAMVKAEQTLNLRLTNTRQPWGLLDVTVTTVVGTREYLIANPAAAYQTAGKTYFATRVTGNSEVSEVPVSFEDFSTATFDKLAPVAGTAFSSERISVYRTNLQNQTLKVIISPVPQEVLTYKLRFYPGALDRSRVTLAGTGQVIELTDYTDQCTMFELLRHCQWKGLTFNENKDRRGEYRSDILLVLAQLETLVDEYIDQINSPVAESIGTWRNR